ncbi:MAG TPA: flagellar basal body rod protein FlgC [Phycisphaerales bacterium]|nr:flagellar basal body rod protein FlgC [Phycisphaerales bacterium]
MYGLLDVSTSGMVAQRVRLEAASANLANQDSLLDSKGNVAPYRRREVMLAAGRADGAADAQGRTFGVHIAQVAVEQSDAKPVKYDPTSPYAYKDGPYKGYVATTGINPVVEHVNALEAARAYEANVMAAEATKQMVAAALRLIA